MACLAAAPPGTSRGDLPPAAPSAAPVTMTPGDIVLKYVCPGLGSAIAMVMWFSPMRAVLEVNRRKSLGELNALPFAMMTVNAIAWMIYGYLLGDYFVFCTNIPGAVLGMFYTNVCYKFSRERAQDVLNAIFMAGITFLSCVALVDLAAVHEYDAQKTLWGSACVAVLMVFYGAPLSTLYKVIRERDSASLHWMLCLTLTINGALWLAYGIAIKNWFIAVPNGVGGAFNAVSLVFCLVFPRRDGSLKDDVRHPPALGANWGGIRLQSARYGGDAVTPGGEAGDGAAPTGRSFLDLTQLRWRTGKSFKQVDSAASIAESDVAAAREGRSKEDAMEAGAEIKAHAAAATVEPAVAAVVAARRSDGEGVELVVAPPSPTKGTPPQS